MKYQRHKTEGGMRANALWQAVVHWPLLNSNA